MQRWLPLALLLLRGDLQGRRSRFPMPLACWARTGCAAVPGRSQPRPARHVKPHPHMAYKGWWGLKFGGLRALRGWRGRGVHLHVPSPAHTSIHSRSLSF